MKTIGDAYGALKLFQGINANYSRDHLLGKKGMHIKHFYVSKNISHLKRCNEIHCFKQVCKGVLRKYLEIKKASISSL